MSRLFRFTEGEGPLLVSIPHAGTHIPKNIAAKMTAAGRTTADTDFFVDRLYGFLEFLNIPTLAATHSRYVVDLNRPPDDATLYPGRFTTGLVPVKAFDGRSLYKEGQNPGSPDIKRRIKTYWRPYHEKLEAELARIRDVYGYALLWDAHSIKSKLPSLFDGQLPDYNFGSNGGLSLRLDVEPAFRECLEGEGISSFTFDGRFRGGYITRNYGQPWQGVHALQLELVQATYMDEAANAYVPEKAVRTAAILEKLIRLYQDMAPY